MGIFNTKWPFYISGTALAITVLLSLYVLNDTIGMGDSMTAASTFCKETLNDGNLNSIPCNFYTVFAIFIVAGAFCASLFSNNFRLQIAPDCGGSFTSRQFKGIFGGFAGGFITMLGIQLSGENVFGHLVGAIQLSGSAWTFLFAMMFSGTLLAILFDRKGISQDGETKK